MAFLKRSKSITGKTYSKPSIKPQNTRRIIRRYHLLITKKDAAYQRLSTLMGTAIDDSNVSQWNKSVEVKECPQEDELLGVSRLDKESLFRLLRKIDYEIHEKGGLQKYQIASIHGQENKRGSDSSKWLFDAVPHLKTCEYRLKALEIGCLSTKNVISRYCETTRIDLNSNEPGILKQDFMERPIPAQGEFDIISCSLVLNFVSTPRKRGEMIQRFVPFLKPNGYLFVVLPLSCITNSRYCDKQLFQEILQSQGFNMTNYHEAKKVVYMCFQLTGEGANKEAKYSKRKIHDGKAMNNFCITL